MITRDCALRLYRSGNNSGDGFPTDGISEDDDTISGAIAYYTSIGSVLIYDRNSSDQVALLRTSDDRLLAIGGDAMGRSAWAVYIKDRGLLDDIRNELDDFSRDVENGKA